ncbi:alcohol oxidase [Marasmius fiardii PR-910]|nr:alcohol oxidase [Marasmius fiardii PR-910]
MWLVELVTALTFAVIVTCNPLLTHPIKRFTYGGDLSKSYDFVIIGGGQAGLALASRLSEDSNTTVLVIEAGDSGEAVQDKISIPSSTYFNSLTKSDYDWSYTTSSQANLGGSTVTWPRGKVLGGSSAINGMYAVRPSEIEVNAWSGLQDSEDTKSWSWSEFYKAMEKSETFTRPSADISNEAKILSDTQSLGSSGPIHTGFPGFTFSTVGDWSTTLGNAGISLNPDPYSGKTWGGFVARSFIDPANWLRSYSRSAYIDPLSNRPNLSILVKNTVTRIIFASADNHTATGVEFAETRDGEKHTVGVNREVVVAAGSIGSPQVLMLSGVGPKDVLSNANVPVQLELPGVGQHLQDHLSLLVFFQTNKDTFKTLQQSGLNTPEFNSFVNSAVAYVNASFIFDGDASAATFHQGLQSQFSADLIPSSSSEVLDGAKAIYDARVNSILPSEVGQIELLFGMMSDTISIGVAQQQPLSQGRLYINSSSAFDYPVIDPNYLSHPADKTILRQGVKLARTLSKIPPLSDSLGTELSPGPNVVSDEDIEKWLAGQVSTEYHPSSSCAMLPQSKGGVVDTNLKVYGLNNVRVADASVFPFVFSTHLGGAVYGLAEQAANIIRAQYNLPASEGPTSVSSSNSSNSNSTPTHSRNSAISYDGVRTLFWTSVGLALAAIGQCI